MAFWAALPVIGTILKTIFGTIDEVIEDKDEANRLKAAVQMQVLNLKSEELKAAASIVTAEVQGQSWLQRNWRPILMLIIIAIVANNYLLFPYLSLFTDKVVLLELPNALWTLMTVGVGGYVVGRSGEKMVNKWKED